jgi:dihydrodipicolinate reductase
MSETLSIAITGASGRMGQMLIKNILKDRRFEICGVTEHPGHEWIGSDIGEMMGEQSSISPHLLQVLHTLTWRLKPDVCTLLVQLDFPKNRLKS